MQTQHQHSMTDNHQSQAPHQRLASTGHIAPPTNPVSRSLTQSELPLAPTRYAFIDGERQRRRLQFLLSSSSMKSVADTVSALTEAKSAALPDWPSVRQALQALSHQANNCREFLELALAQIHLHHYTRQHSPLRLLPTLLVGPPGVGKTFIVERLARALRIPSERVSLSHATEAFILSGCPQGYGTSTPGEIAQKLAQSPVINPIIILDELDKAAYVRSDRATVEGPLLALLEPETASHFEDACLRLSLDARHVTWIATANSTAGIPEPILSRFQVITIGALPDSERLMFLERTARRILLHHGLGSRHWRFDAGVAERLAGLSIRTLRNALALLLAKHLLKNPDATEWVSTEDELAGILPPTTRSRTIGFL